MPAFKCGSPIFAAGAKDLTLDEAMLAAYVTDPTALARMTFKMVKGSEDIAAYFASIKQSLS